MVELNKTATLNLTIEPGQVATTVEVEAAAAPPIDTTTAQISNTYDAQEAQIGIASAGSGVINLSLLQPGVTTSGGIGYGTGPSISGQRPTNNNFTVEGIDNNDQSVTGPVTTVPNDAVAEFSVLANQFSPEFGHSSGGQFNTVVKSGSNTFHGSAYEYVQNRNLNATDTIYGGEKPRYDNNRFGGSVGGPIIKNKLFFFGLAEYNPVGSAGGTPQSVCAPTTSGFATLDSIAGLNATNYAVFKKYVPVGTGDPCAPTTVSGQSIALASLQSPTPNYQNSLNTVGSIDYNISPKDQLRGRWIYNKVDEIDTAATLSEFYSPVPIRAHTVAITEFHTFTDRITNEFRLGFNRLANSYTVPSMQFPGLSMFPNLTFDGALGGLQIGPDPNAPQYGNQNTYQLSDNVTWMKGAHTLKFGFDGRRLIAPSLFVQRMRGDYYWTDTASGQNALDQYLNDFSPNEFGERTLANGSPVYYGNQWSFGFFGNDSWKVNQHLTLNLGLRYEYATVPQSESLQAMNSAASVPGLIDFSAPKPSATQFMPRFGFAYAPGTDGKTSIRGGIGMSYDVLYTNLGTLALPPQYEVTVDTEGITPGFLAGGGIAPQADTFDFGTAADQRAASSAYLPAKQQNPYSINWNFGVQHVFNNVWTADVRYVGTHGMHLPVQSRLNRQSPTSVAGSLPVYMTAPSQATLDALTNNLAAIKGTSSYVPAYADAGFDGANIVGFMPYGASIYHGLQTSLDRRFTKGFQMIASYTWSHAEDNSTAAVYSTVLSPRRPQDFQDWHNEWANSGLDRRHRLTISAIYESSFKTHGTFLKEVLDGWNIQPQYTFESPEYATVLTGGVDTNLNGDSAGDRAYMNAAGVAGTSTGSSALCTSSLPSGVTCGSAASYKYLVAYVANDPNARYVNQGVGAVSNVPRNTLAMPRTNNWNLSAGKKFYFSEHANFEFQAQAFNIFNHAQWTPGRITDVAPLSNLNTMPLLTAGGSEFDQPSKFFSSNPRTMQLVVKINF